MKSKEFFYEPPMIEVIEVDVEGGFAVSGYGSYIDAKPPVVVSVWMKKAHPFGCAFV